MLPFDAAVLVPKEAPDSGARFAAQALETRGCATVSGAAVLEAMRAAGMSDPGQVRCCLPELTQRLGADAILLGRIESFGAVGSSMNFWRAISNMADVRFNYSERGRRQSRRYLSVAVSFDLLDGNGALLWRGESDRWVAAASLPPLRDADENIYRDMLYAVKNAMSRLPSCGRAGSSP